MERKKTVRLAMKITEAIIGILKDEFGEKNENKPKKTKKVRKTGRTTDLRAFGDNHNGQAEGR